MKSKNQSFWLIVCVFYLAYSALYIARLNFSVASVLLEKDQTLTKAQIGMIGCIFSIVYAVVKIPAGFLGDRFSPRLLIASGLLMTAIGNLLIARTARFGGIAVLWGLNACGQALLWGAILRNLTERFGEGRGHMAARYLVTSTAFGSIAGLWLAGLAADAWGVQACFSIPGLFALIMAAVVLCLPKEKGEGRGVAARQQPWTQGIKELLENPQFRINIFPAVAHGMIKDNINIWMALYFVDTYGIDLKTMAGFVFFIPFMSLIGRLLFPLLCRILKSESRVCVAAFTLCAAFMALLIMRPGSPEYAMLCLGGASAMVGAVNTYLLTSPTDYVKSGHIALAAGLMDTLTYGGAGIGSLCFGRIVTRLGYNTMFLIWALVSATAAMILICRCVWQNRSNADRQQPA